MPSLLGNEHLLLQFHLPDGLLHRFQLDFFHAELCLGALQVSFELGVDLLKLFELLFHVCQLVLQLLLLVVFLLQLLLQFLVFEKDFRKIFGVWEVLGHRLNSVINGCVCLQVLCEKALSFFLSQSLLQLLDFLCHLSLLLGPLRHLHVLLRLNLFQLLLHIIPLFFYLLGGGAEPLLLVPPEHLVFCLQSFSFLIMLLPFLL